MKLTIIPVGMLGTNCYLLASDSGSCFVIDPGAQPEKLVDVIKDRGLTPGYILLTHGHHDHIGGVQGLLREYPGVKVYIGEGDMDMLTDPSINGVHRRGLDPENYLISEAKTTKEGDVFELDGMSMQALETPGHSKGGMTYICENLMFTGDTLFLGDVGRTDLYGGSYDVLKASLKKLCEQPGDYNVYPGHGESTTLDYERANNRYINE